MSNALHAMLSAATNVDPAAAIDPAEVEAIARTVEQIKILAVDFAEGHDTEETKQYLAIIVQLLKSAKGLTPDEFVAYLSGTSQGALGAGIGRSAAQDANHKDRADKAELRVTELDQSHTLLNKLAGILGIGRTGDPSKPFDAKLAKDLNDRASELVTIEAASKKAPAPTSTDTVPKTEVLNLATKARKAFDKVKLIMGDRDAVNEPLDELIELTK